MAISTPKCLDVQLPGGGKINNCAQGVPNTVQYNSPPIETTVDNASLVTPAYDIGIEESVGNATLAETLESLGIDISEESKNNMSLIFAELMSAVPLVEHVTGEGIRDENTSVSNLISALTTELMTKNTSVSNLIPALTTEICFDGKDNDGDGDKDEAADCQMNLIGEWNMTGNSNGYPISAEIVFLADGHYKISGKLSDLPNGNISPFSYIGNYTLDTPGKVLELTPITGTTGITTSYNLRNTGGDSFSASNDKTSEHYTFTRV